MEENGYTVPDDEMESQTAGFVPGYNPYGDGDDYGEDYGDSYGDYPAYCHRYTTDSGDEHVEMCGFHAQLAEMCIRDRRCALLGKTVNPA